MTSASCPGPGRWRELLDGVLTQSEQAELTEHLETCNCCQETLELLAADRGVWGAARQVGREEPVEGIALRRVLQEARSGRERPNDSVAPGDEPILPWLKPPADPRSLGRLGPYDVQEVLGRGGMGVVLRAFDQTLNRWVAIKVLAPLLAASSTARKRFLREARAAAAIAHEHVIAVHAVEEFDGLPCLVMPYLRGGSLQERLNREGALPTDDVLRLGIQIAEGLAAAHAEGLVHRDIKPANILLDQNGGVKITDFGLARTVDDVSLTHEGVVAGTPQYMAPEQARGEHLDYRADLFSLGSVLYTLCTGRPPFEARNNAALLRQVAEAAPPPIQELSPQTPSALIALIAKLHAKRPADRIQSAADVAETLRRVRSQAQSAAPRDTPVEDRVLPSRASSSPWLIGVALGIGACVLLAAGLVISEAAGIASLFSFKKAENAVIPDSDNAAAPALDQEQLPSLRYGWQAGKDHVYAVNIEADDGETIETLAGNSFYAVRAVAPNDVTLAHRGTLFPFRRNKQGAPLGLGVGYMTPFSPFSGVGFPTFPGGTELHLDDAGRITRTTGSSQLPYLLGDLARLILAPLGPPGQKSWEETETLSFVMPERGANDFPGRTPGTLPMSVGPGFRRPAFGRPAPVQHIAQEHSTYTLGSVKGAHLGVKKVQDIASSERLAGKPRFHRAGEGEWIFDRQAGVPRKLELHAKLTEQTATASFQTDVRLTVRLLEGEERERALHPPPPPKPERKPLSEAELSQALADLKTTDSGRRQGAANRLAAATVTNRRAEIAQALETVLADPDLFTRTAGAKALGVWGSKENVPALIKLLGDKEAFPRAAAIEALAQLKDERALDPLAGRLIDFFDRGHASQALKDFGAAAEKAVARQLQQHDDAVRLEVCKILKDIGTKQSVPALQTAQQDRNQQLVEAASAALAAIESRRR